MRTASRSSARSLRRAALVATAAAALVTFGAAPAGAAGGSGILDFSRVAKDAPRVQLGADGMSAVVRVETSPPTVCAVAFGPTPAFGRIANDPGMGGHAIARHVVTLTGLRPSTRYHFRLTATDAGGRVYQTRSDLAFTTRRASTATAGLVDVAVGARVAAVSSQWSADFAAANAIDGDLATEWSSAGDGNRAFLTVDLGKVVQVAAVAFRTRAMADGSAITRTYAVVVDGKRRLGPFPAGNKTDPRLAAVAARGRTFRFEVVRSSGGNTGAAEIGIYARQ